MRNIIANKSDSNHYPWMKNADAKYFTAWGSQSKDPPCLRHHEFMTIVCANHIIEFAQSISTFTKERFERPK